MGLRGVHCTVFCFGHASVNLVGKNRKRVCCRRMLHQIKINHESQRSEGLAKNFQLLRDVNENIELVQRIYSQIGEEYVSFMKAHSSHEPENLPQSNDGEDQST